MQNNPRDFGFWGFVVYKIIKKFFDNSLTTDAGIASSPITLDADENILFQNLELYLDGIVK